MPRPPQPAARRGTRFHAWVESRFEELPLFGPDDLPGQPTGARRGDRRRAGPGGLKEAFLRTPYADRTPYRVEAPFQLTLAGRVVRGRIDAVYREAGRTAPRRTRSSTGRPAARRTADPLQLAIYRLAWAERHAAAGAGRRAAFLYVRSGEIVRPADLPDRAALERLLHGGR